MTDLERTMGAILSDGLGAMAEAAGFSRNGITADLTEMVERAEKKAVDFRELADFYHGDNPEYQIGKLRRIRKYLRTELMWETDNRRWAALKLADDIVLEVIRKDFGGDE